MPCFRPLTGYRFHGNHCDCWHQSGALKIYFGGRKLAEMFLRFGETHEVLTLPCGKCIGCQLQRAGEWAMRCMHEYRSYTDGCFLTLTYDDSHLPPNRSLRVKDFQDFMKRLRIHRIREEKANDPIKYFMCGEYGPAKGRPHYHAVIFGWSPKDLVEVPNNPGAADQLYDSAILAGLWRNGRVRIGALSARSCAYVARYCMKKLYGSAGEKEYEETGRIPPYNGMSKGIGREYFFRFKGDFYPADFIVDEETFTRKAVPRFYDKLLEALDKGEYEIVKRNREERASKSRHAHAKDQTPERLEVREECLRLKLRRAVRRVDEGVPK